MNSPLDNKLSVICPFSKPDCLENVLRQWNDQSLLLHDRRLILVCNGGAIGSFIPKRDIPGIYVLNSESGVARAMNWGLAVARENWEPHPWTKWDCDDEYGPHYLAELVLAMHEHPEFSVFGKRAHWTVLSDGSCVCFNADEGPGVAPWICGPTLSCKTTECPDFDESLVSGSDQRWLHDCEQRHGWKPYSTGPNNFVYHRDRDDHVWVASDLTVRWVRGDAKTVDGNVLKRPGPKDVLHEVKQSGPNVPRGSLAER